MYKSKIIQVLSELPQKDLRRFREFVHSPYFNKHQKTTELLDYLLAQKNWESPRLKKETVFKYLFPKQVYEEQLLRTLMSYLLQLLRKFYMQKNYEQDGNAQQLDLMKAALQDGQQKLFELTVSQWERKRSGTNIRNNAWYLQQSNYYRLRDDFDLTFGKRIAGDFLAKGLKNFDTYYLAEKLKIVCQTLARKQVTGRDFEFPLMAELSSHLKKEQQYFEQIPAVWLYFLIYQMMSNSSTSYFYQLKERLAKEVGVFKAEEGRDLYTHAINFCVGRVNFGEADFKKETFELYQQMLNNGLLYIERILPQWDYTNIVSLGCDLKESKWTKTFINTQREYLAPAVKENTYTYNLAAFYYAQQNYTEAAKLLQKVAFTDVYYNLLTRLLLLKIYFETETWQALDSFLSTFRTYLLRNKQIGENRRRERAEFDSIYQEFI